ncbi:hypothetical protein HPB50_016656 [Hyalomma asiaticum]|uniref:Uncharacterized protein n=1 Tax=Hyalomma asiaticum TaxID=266040 RepID=A0ACB7TJM1_HYAAI|nr:hypothetical protein HPB50_016656 [Hyalomma asiaticum]
MPGITATPNIGLPGPEIDLIRAAEQKTWPTGQTDISPNLPQLRPPPQPEHNEQLLPAAAGSADHWASPTGRDYDGGFRGKTPGEPSHYPSHLHVSGATGGAVGSGRAHHRN